RLCPDRSRPRRAKKREGLLPGNSPRRHRLYLPRRSVPNDGYIQAGFVAYGVASFEVPREPTLVPSRPRRVSCSVSAPLKNSHAHAGIGLARFSLWTFAPSACATITRI